MPVAAGSALRDARATSTGALVVTQAVTNELRGEVTLPAAHDGIVQARDQAGLSYFAGRLI